MVRIVDPAGTGASIVPVVNTPITLTNGVIITLLANGTFDVQAPITVTTDTTFGYFIEDAFGQPANAITFVMINIDTDGDGVDDDDDIDADNDGILDVNEGFSTDTFAPDSATLTRGGVDSDVAGVETTVLENDVVRYGLSLIHI